MDLNHYQRWTKSTAVYEAGIDELITEGMKPGNRYLIEGALIGSYLALGLASESGEFAGKYKKVLRDKHSQDTVEDLAQELGDQLWYLARSAHALGYTLEELAQLNHDKLEDRKRRGKLGGSGDKR